MNGTMWKVPRIENAGCAIEQLDIDRLAFSVIAVQLD